MFQESPPERFLTYTQLPDQRGFTIQGCDFVFRYDQYGGWKDQHGYYYDCDGLIATEPKDSKQLSESFNQEDAEDHYEELYPKNYSLDEEEEDQFENLDYQDYLFIEKNVEILQKYPDNVKLRVFFSNIDNHISQKQLFNHFSHRVEGIINLIFQKNSSNDFYRAGYFILRNAKVAEKLCKIEGEKIKNRKIHFTPETLQGLLVRPLQEKEWRSFNSKKVHESKTGKNEEKKEILKYSRYALNFQVFETKTRFVNWMLENGGVRDVDYKNFDKKEQGNKIIISVEIRNTLIEQLKGKKYNNKLVIFTPI